jgi:protein-L-isoaspartate(D-aspartate) O-methyltransferase
MAETGDPAQALIEALKRHGDLDDPQVEAAFRAIPRHLFLPDLPLDKVYIDEAVPIKRDADGTVLSSSSQPSMMAMMLSQLRLRRGDNVLEIGAGTGYNAALMQYIVGDSGMVTTIELDADLAKQARDHLQQAQLGQVRVVEADGSLGYAPRAAYDRIIATVGIWDVPAKWIEQLKQDGILVAPLWLDALQFSAALRFESDSILISDHNLPCGFIRLRGPASGPDVYTHVASSGLWIVSNSSQNLDGAALHNLLSDDMTEAFLGAPLTSAEYWQGFVPYLMLHAPEGFEFGVYMLAANQPAYGLEGPGFTLITQGSAVFTPYAGQGKTYSVAGSDALIALQEALADWEAGGRPGRDQLRIRLVPIPHGIPTQKKGKLYTRHDHYVEVWLERESL